MEDVSGLCLGCGRSRDEIAAWAGADDGRRRAIWSSLPERLASLGIAVTRLPWSHRQILDFAIQTIQRRSGTWVFGCHGATAEFMVGPDEQCSVSVADDRITAFTEQAGLRLRLGDHVRALQLRDDYAADGYRAIFLVILKARANLPVASGLSVLGPDAAAIEPRHQGQTLYDLGLGRTDLRFNVRTSAPALRRSLEGARGLPLSSLLPTVGVQLMTESPTRVAESSLGRVEVHTAIPPPGGKSPDGPHTHLLPSHLATGRATRPGIDLPPVYALGATFHPRAAPEADTPSERAT
jgi:predicted Fe-S protein YdhL (DUF1289 family)